MRTIGSQNLLICVSLLCVSSIHVWSFAAPSHAADAERRELEVLPSQVTLGS
ncbi:MAG: hypothetical protein ACI9HK_003017, partial [Pirellulaceae bacterium]